MTDARDSRDWLDNPTRGYAPTSGWLFGGLGGSLAQLLDGDAVFTWLDVPRMCRDPMIRFGLRLLRSPLPQVEFTVRARSPKIKLFVERTIQRFWSADLPRLASDYYKWGRAVGGAEFAYDRRHRRITLEHVRRIAPFDAQARVWRAGRNAGRLAGYDVVTPRGPRPVGHPHCFWFAGHEELGPLHDVPRLSGAFTPFLEKNTKGGARHSRRLWYWTCAFRGHRIRHPNTMVPLPNGAMVHSEDLARQYYESAMNGHGSAMPNDPHPDEKMAGKYAWEIEEPESRADMAGLLDYPKELDGEIMTGLDIPEEIWRAGGQGGGWSGRAIPMELWYGQADETAGMFFAAFKKQVLDPLVMVNFRTDEYEVEVGSLVKQFRQQGEQQSQQKGDGGDPPQAQQGRPAGNGPVPYKGPHGGTGVLDPGTGKVRYGANLSQTPDWHGRVGKIARRDSRNRRVAALAMLTLQEKAHAEGDPRKYADQCGAIGALCSNPIRLHHVLRGGADLSWVYDEGPRGGKRWRNTETGRVIYAREEPGAQRTKREASVKRARELTNKISGHQHTAEDLAELATHLPALPVDRLRATRQVLMASFGNARKRDGMVKALLAHVGGLKADAGRDEPPAKEPEPAAPPTPKPAAKTDTATKPRLLTLLASPSDDLADPRANVRTGLSHMPHLTAEDRAEFDERIKGAKDRDELIGLVSDAHQRHLVREADAKRAGEVPTVRPTPAAAPVTTPPPPPSTPPEPLRLGMATADDLAAAADHTRPAGERASALSNLDTGALDAVQDQHGGGRANGFTGNEYARQLEKAWQIWEAGRKTPADRERLAGEIDRHLGRIRDELAPGLRSMAAAGKAADYYGSKPIDLGHLANAYETHSAAVADAMRREAGIKDPRSSPDTGPAGAAPPVPRTASPDAAVRAAIEPPKAPAGAGALLPDAAKAGVSPAAAERAETYLRGLGSPPPPPAPGTVRLYRGEWQGKTPHENAFFADDRGLAGVAVPFARSAGRHLVYVDVPKDVAEKGLQGGAVTDGEYQLPEEYRRQIRPWGHQSPPSH